MPHPGCLIRWVEQGETPSAKMASFFKLPQASPPTEVQHWLSDPGTNLDYLARFPNVKRAFVWLNTAIPYSTPVECLFSKGRDVFSIKRGRLADGQAGSKYSVTSFENKLSRFCLVTNYRPSLFSSEIKIALPLYGNFRKFVIETRNCNSYFFGLGNCNCNTGAHDCFTLQAPILLDLLDCSPKYAWPTIFCKSWLSLRET